jgi:hypothetical protein
MLGCIVQAGIFAAILLQNKILQNNTITLNSVAC